MVDKMRLPKIEIAKELLKLATGAVELKQRTSKRERRREVIRQVHIKAAAKVDRVLTKALEPLFLEQIADMAANLKAIDGEKSNTTKDTDGIDDRDDVARILAQLIFDLNDPKWQSGLIDRALPVLATEMMAAAKIQLDMLGVPASQLGAGVQVETGTTSTASQWLNQHPENLTRFSEMLEAADVPIGIITEMPDWMLKDIADQLTDTFSQDYWKDIHQTTLGDAEQVLRKGLNEGWGIDRMAREMATSFQGGTAKYAKMRSLRIARTESAHALNGARSGAIQGFKDGLPPEVSQFIKRSWISILSDTTRAAHAELDGVPEDENGEWNLNGVKARWPGDIRLPPGDRINCQCTIGTEMGMQEDESQQLRQEHVERVQVREEEEADAAALAA